MRDLEPYAFLACCDFSGLVRGKGFAARELEARRRRGVGWTPTNIMINCFGRIPATPWGALGDLALVPGPDGDFTIDFQDGGPVERILLCDIHDLMGQAWACCPRSYLRQAAEDLAARHRLRLRVAFEQEFHLGGLTAGPGAAYGLEAVRSAGRFPGLLLAQMKASGLELDTFLPEYGPGQFEVTVKPATAGAAADRAIMVREVVRGLARRLGLAASFSPVVTPGIVGNGVHIHFSIEDLDGRPLSFDPAAEHGVSERAARFIAGILRSGRALCAVVAPSVISYERLKPNSWSTFATNLGWRDREAFVRICPIPDAPGADVVRQFNFELRSPDGAACPYLALGALIRAGTAGLDEDLARPPATVDGARSLSDEARKAAGIESLPTNLEAALQALEADTVLMPEAMKGPYVMLKRGEAAHVEGLDLDALAALYAQVY
jgi:glutamine synthetase